MPYFKIYGKSLGDGTDDIHVKLYKYKLNSLEGSFQDAQFFITSAAGIAIDDGTGQIIDDRPERSVCPHLRPTRL